MIRRETWASQDDHLFAYLSSFIWGKHLITGFPSAKSSYKTHTGTQRGSFRTVHDEAVRALCGKRRVRPLRKHTIDTTSINLEACAFEIATYIHHVRTKLRLIWECGRTPAGAMLGKVSARLLQTYTYGGLLAEEGVRVKGRKHETAVFADTMGMGSCANTAACQHRRTKAMR